MSNIKNIDVLLLHVNQVKNTLNYMKKIESKINNKEITKDTYIEYIKINKLFKATILGSLLFPLFPLGTEYVYVWELQKGKYYVGYSSNLFRRFNEHISNQGANWTKKYKPISIIEIVRGNQTIEKLKTLEYMKKKGFENVRGSHWCSIDYKKIPKEVLLYIKERKIMYIKPITKICLIIDEKN